MAKKQSNAYITFASHQRTSMIVDGCQQDKCYKRSVLTHMECDAREKYTFYVRINDEHRVKKNSFISISQVHISNSLICTVLCVSPANFFFATHRQFTAIAVLCNRYSSSSLLFHTQKRTNTIAYHNDSCWIRPNGNFGPNTTSTYGKYSRKKTQFYRYIICMRQNFLPDS